MVMGVTTSVELFTSSFNSTCLADAPQASGSTCLKMQSSPYLYSCRASKADSSSPLAFHCHYFHLCHGWPTTTFARLPLWVPWWDLLGSPSSKLCHFDCRPQRFYHLVKLLGLLVPVHICGRLFLELQPEHRYLGHDVLKSFQRVHQSFECEVVSAEWRVPHL